MFEVIGSDIFEWEHENHTKYKFQLIRDRACGLVMVYPLQQYGGTEGPSAWEPTTSDVIRGFSHWLMHNPAPRWILTDSATYFISQQMMDFAGRSGIGLLTTPAESHQMLGAEEGSIRVLKSTVERLIREEPTIAIEDAFMLAAHGHNQSVGLSGFSPFQWTRGSASPSENLPLGLDPKKAFDGVLRLKEKARIAFEMESAKSRLSKLNNTISRPQVSYKPGQLVMLWRQRPGRVGGSWIGLLHTEGRTLWLATGATIIRARDVQVRPCTRREELNANLEGTAILRMPFTIESLLRSFTGRHFSDVTGDVPSMEQMQSDLSAADVQQEPSAAQPVRSDTWKLHNEDGTSWLIRVHNMPRLALLTPARATTCPFDDASLTGVRQTRLRGIPKGSETVKLEDNYKESDEPNRLMQERWIGETWLEIKPESRPAKTRKSMISQTTTGQKRKSENADRDDVQDDESKDDEVVPDEGLDQQPDDQDRVLPQVPGISPLTTALRDRGANAVDGIRRNPAVGTSCPIESCHLPGICQVAMPVHMKMRMAADSLGLHNMAVWRLMQLMLLLNHRAVPIQRSWSLM